MPRDWMDEHRGERRDRWAEREKRAARSEHDDFGQADFSKDYVYDPDRRSAHRATAESDRQGDDYGQADYSQDYGYDRASGHGYRRFAEEDRDQGREGTEPRYGRAGADDDRRGDPPRGEPPPGERSRSWADRAGAFFSGREEGAEARRRRGPSDRVLWTVIVERLENERGLDLRDVEVLVENAEVTLNGLVRRKEEKRRIEDLADIDGVRHLQNNLRVRDSRRRWF